MTGVNQSSECDFNLSVQISSFVPARDGEGPLSLQVWYEPGVSPSPEWDQAEAGHASPSASSSESAQLVALQGRRPRGGWRPRHLRVHLP